MKKQLGAITFNPEDAAFYLGAFEDGVPSIGRSNIKLANLAYNGLQESDEENAIKPIKTKTQNGTPIGISSACFEAYSSAREYGNGGLTGHRMDNHIYSVGLIRLLWRGMRKMNKSSRLHNGVNMIPWGNQDQVYPLLENIEGGQNAYQFQNMEKTYQPLEDKGVNKKIKPAVLSFKDVEFHKERQDEIYAIMPFNDETELVYLTGSIVSKIEATVKYIGDVMNMRILMNMLSGCGSIMALDHKSKITQDEIWKKISDHFDEKPDTIVVNPVSATSFVTMQLVEQHHLNIVTELEVPVKTAYLFNRERLTVADGLMTAEAWKEKAGLRIGIHKWIKPLISREDRDKHCLVLSNLT